MNDITLSDLQFPIPGKMVAQGPDIYLKMIHQSEKDDYISLSKALSIIKSVYSNESFVDGIWNQFLSPEKITASIYTNNGQFIGYCYIHDTSKELWELGIELFPEWCNQSYGTRSAQLYLTALTNATGRTQFRARVATYNVASQKMMAKLGGICIGVSEFLFHGEKLLEYQAKHASEIDEYTCGIASQLGLPPQSLIGQFLEYRINIPIKMLR